MASLVALLDHPKCVRSSLLHDRIIKLMMAMLGPQLDVSRRTAGALGRTIMMPGGRGRVVEAEKEEEGEGGKGG
jgi:hypothetical protein